MSECDARSYMQMVMLALSGDARGGSVVLWMPTRCVAQLLRERLVGGAIAWVESAAVRRVVGARRVARGDARGGRDAEVWGIVHRLVLCCCQNLKKNYCLGFFFIARNPLSDVEYHARRTSRALQVAWINGGAGGGKTQT